MQSRNDKKGGLMKKLIAYVATFALVVSSVLLPTNAFAANSFTMKITGGLSGREYQGFQIFSGTADKNTLSNVEWGSSMKDSAAFLTALKSNDAFKVDGKNIFADATTAADVAAALGKATDETGGTQPGDSAIAMAFALKDAEKCYVREEKVDEILDTWSLRTS